MRYLVAIFGVVAAAGFVGTPAQAQNYPWCEYLGGGEGGGGGRNCGFVSFEQCMESARGNGGDCRQNTQYEPPPGVREHVGATPAYGAHQHHAKRTTHKNS
jgi:hypothetical protein